MRLVNLVGLLEIQVSSIENLLRDFLVISRVPKSIVLDYTIFPKILEGYSDANWISGVGDNLSTTGWVFTLGGGAISWGSKKQTCISHSTMEA